MATAVEVGRAMTYRAGAAIEADAEDATRLASTVKLFRSERAVEATDEAVQVHGGTGCVSDYPVERHYRDARITGSTTAPAGYSGTSPSPTCSEPVPGPAAAR